MQHKVLPRLVAVAVASGAMALGAGEAAAATQLPRCAGTVLDKGPTLFSGVNSAPRPTAAGSVTIPAVDPPVVVIPGADVPEIPGVEVPGVGGGGGGIPAADIPSVDLPGLDPPDIPLPPVLPDGVTLIDGGDLGIEVICVDGGPRGKGRPPAPGAAGAERGRGHCRATRVPAFKMRANRARKAVLCLIDRARGRRGKGALRPSKPLKRAAKSHTRRMIGSGCFAHQCNGEPALPSRVTRSGYLPCNCRWSVGENIAYGRGRSASPKAIVGAWMSSPPHKQAILGSFEHGDVGVRKGAPGKRRFKGATFTMNFGAKR